MKKPTCRITYRLEREGSQVRVYDDLMCKHLRTYQFENQEAARSAFKDARKCFIPEVAIAAQSTLTYGTHRSI